MFRKLLLLVVFCGPVYADTVCPPGKYYAYGEMNACTDVPAGYFTEDQGGDAYYVPIPCPPGRYQPQPGQTSCLVAPAGKIASWPATSVAENDLTNCPYGSISLFAESVICEGIGNINIERSILYNVPTQIFTFDESTVMLQARNDFDQPLSFTAIDAISIQITHETNSNQTANVELLNGEAVVTFTSSYAGEFEITTTINGHQGPSAMITVLDSTVDSDDDGINDGDDVDIDNDGLIEIHSLAELHLIREDLAGESLNGRTSGCPNLGCNGYELTNDLNFDTDADGILADEIYWNNGEGWLPIGDFSNRYTGDFKGNGFTISNLFIQRTANNQGLFGALRYSNIYNLNIAGPLTSVSGSGDVGLLAGSITDSYINTVNLTGNVVGESRVGLLTGLLYQSDATNVSTSGVATSLYGSIGGIAGSISDVYGYTFLSLKNSISHTRIKFEGTDNVNSGISQQASDAKAQNSYWNITTSNQTTASDNGGFLTSPLGYSDAELKCPTTPNDNSCSVDGLYSDWDTSIWSFGSNQQSPALMFREQAFRDSDFDGVEDSKDQFADNQAAAIDADLDGKPDYWNRMCDLNCQNTSGLILDSHLNDADNDNIYDAIDAFPNDSAASIDEDQDGFPDVWHEGCEIECQNSSSLMIDPFLNDNDNDGSNNDEDVFINDPAAFLDNDNDGFPDAWADGCDVTCQNESSLTLDGFINDNDNDGSNNDEDAFINDAAAFLDADNDGFPDAWADGCDVTCQNESSLTLDMFINDNDNDGSNNDEDAFINDAAAFLDGDNDGFPDAWVDGCDVTCQNESSLILDMFINDNDNDGSNNDEDAFINDAAAYLDGDNDGFPDVWADGCDVTCQNESSLTLDVFTNDNDNDGSNNDEDAFINDPAAFLDADNDGFPDAWNENCDISCQNTSSLTLDLFLNDKDNDGSSDDVDAFPNDPAASLDNNNDGFADQWNENCDVTCQQNSSLKLDNSKPKASSIAWFLMLLLFVLVGPIKTGQYRFKRH